MTTITMPTTLRPASVEWGLIVPQLLARSAFDGSVQAQTMGAPRWFTNIETGPLRADEVPQWEALIQRLRGGMNRLQLWDWRREAALGVATGTPLVRTTVTGGASVASKGWTPSVTGILLAGTYLGIAGELKRLSVDANSDASGFATLSFEPPLRGTATLDTSIVKTKPTALFVLTTERPAMTQRGARHAGWALAFEEVFL